MSDKDKKRSRGADEKYTDEYLNKLLDEFVKKNPLDMLNPNQLEKQTKVPRHTWMRRKSEQIKRLKSRVQLGLGGKGDEDFIVFQNIAELVDKFWNNKEGLIKALRAYEETIQKFYDKSRGYDDTISQNTKLKEEVIEYKEQLKIAQKEVEFYKSELNKVSILSKSPTERTDQNLRNVLDIDKHSKKSVDKAISFDFRKNHTSLFDET